MACENARPACFGVLLILLAIIFGCFLFFGDSASRTEHGSPETAHETPFGTVHTSSRDQSLLPALLNLDAFDDRRHASITLAWPMERMGSSYEERLRRLRSRAPSLASDECRRLLRSVASDCRVGTTTASLWGESALLKMNLAFIPQQDFGTVPTAQELQLDAFPLDYPDFNKHGVRDSEEGAADRAAIYAEVARDCREVAQVYGNCVLYQIRIDTHLMGPAGNRSIWLYSKAKIAIIRQRTFTE